MFHRKTKEEIRITMFQLTFKEAIKELLLINILEDKFREIRETIIKDSDFI